MEKFDPHTEMSERTSVLANERTYAAWIRTGLSALISGLASEKFLDGMMPFAAVRSASMILLLFALSCFALAAWRYYHVGVRMVTTSVSGAPEILLVFLSGFLVLVALISIVGIWLT